MGWFKPKLEPGERVVTAIPGREDHGFWVGMGAFLLIIEGALAIAMHAFLEIDRFTFGAVLWGSVALLGFASSRWRLVVTDRRLLHRRGLPPSRVEEIRLGEIESVHTEMGSFAERIVVRAGGRDMVISMIGIDPAPIAQALRGAAGIS